jgi:hypothetical protein
VAGSVTWAPESAMGGWKIGNLPVSPTCRAKRRHRAACSEGAAGDPAISSTGCRAPGAVSGSGNGDSEATMPSLDELTRAESLLNEARAKDTRWTEALFGSVAELVRREMNQALDRLFARLPDRRP